MYYLVDCDIARGVGLLIVNKDSRKGSQNVKTNNRQYLYRYFNFYRYLPSIYHEEILSCKLAHPIQFSV